MAHASFFRSIINPNQIRLYQYKYIGHRITLMCQHTTRDPGPIENWREKINPAAPERDALGTTIMMVTQLGTRLVRTALGFLDVSVISICLLACYYLPSWTCSFLVLLLLRKKTLSFLPMTFCHLHTFHGFVRSYWLLSSGFCGFSNSPMSFDCRLNCCNRGTVTEPTLVIRWLGLGG